MIVRPLLFICLYLAGAFITFFYGIQTAALGSLGLLILLWVISLNKLIKQQKENEAERRRLQTWPSQDRGGNAA